MSISVTLDRAGAWFLESGIQEPLGGVARYYRADLGENRLVSTEITGYSISTYVYLHQLRGSPGYLDAAQRAARFLVRTAWNSEWRTIPFEYAPDSADEALAYFFDLGIIARGLLSLWRVTRQPELLETARAAGEAMARDFPAHSAGGYHPIIRLPAKDPLPGDDRWSRQPGCYQLKAALAWHDLFEATGEQAFRDRFGAALASALGSYQQFLPGSTNPERVMDRLHPFCYFLEGILPCVSEPACANAMRYGLDVAPRYLRDIAPTFVRSDVYAQILRARLFADRAGVAPLDRLAASEEAEALLRFQASALDIRQHGGFLFGRRGTELLPHVNPVSAAFAVQALSMWDQFRRGTPADAYPSLI